MTLKTNKLDDLRRLLDYTPVLDLIKGAALSPFASEALGDLRFMQHKGEIEIELTRVCELRDILINAAPFPLQVQNIEGDLEIAGVDGNLLSCEALVRIADTLATCRKLRDYLAKRKDANPELWGIALKIATYKDLEHELAAKVDFQAVQLKDTASPTLNQIRKEIARAEQAARKTLDNLFRKYAEKGYMQDSAMTITDGRLVFPVKSEHKNRIKGVVHNQSATGATFFIEPLESLQINNEIQHLKTRENREVERILRQLTALIHAELPGVRKNFNILVQFDVIHAKATFARDFNCVQPSFNDNNTIYILEGRHPLLRLHKKTADQVVPLNIKIDGDIKTLIISGPNAGGKSVAMKTVGLFALMLQSGIPIPAEPDSSMPVFDEIFADIGDFQSIEDDLSTFTSHIKGLCRILQDANSHSLVLLDEIGVGTDPNEGSALSIALLEELTRRGCKTLATTHHGNLKVFAFESDGVENGSMELDPETLQPSYRFKAGVPGSSYALEISRRMGLPENILSRSQEILGEKKYRVDRMLMELDKKSQKSQKLVDKLELDKIRLEGLSRLYRDKLEAVNREERMRRQEALEKAQAVLEASNALIEKTVREIREKQADKVAISSAKHAIKQQKDRILEELDELDETGFEDKPSTSFTLANGMDVLWKTQNKVGTIIKIQEGEEKVLLQVGSMNFWVPRRELAPAPQTKARQPARASVRIDTAPKSDVLPEIDVRGHLLDEAVEKVDKFLDDAVLAGWGEVRIIHGKGTGALRRGLADFLETHARVKNKKIGAWNEGDLGVTIVELH